MEPFLYALYILTYGVYDAVVPDGGDGSISVFLVVLACGFVLGFFIARKYSNG